MNDLAGRIAKLSPEKRKILEEKLKEKKIAVLEDSDSGRGAFPGRRSYARIEPAAPREYFPLSSTQKGLFILIQMGNPGMITFTGLLEGALDPARFEATFQKLVQRHAAFRSSFELLDGEPVQKIYPEVNFTLDYREIDPGATQVQIQKFFQPFDISRPPLLKTGLLKIGTDRHLLLVGLSHLIADGISLNILLQEFHILDQGGVLPELRVQYQDYAQWQNEFRLTPAYQKQENYWLERFPGEIPVLNLPLDFPRGKQSKLPPQALTLSISREFVEKLTRLANHHRITLPAVFLATYALFLSKYSGQEEVVIGLINAGRQHPDLENMIGMLIKSLPVKIETPPEATLREYLQSASETMITAFENQDYDFEKLLTKLPDESKNQLDSLSNVQFIFHNEYEAKSSTVLGDLKLSGYPAPMEQEESKQLDLLLDIMPEESQELTCLFSYNPNLLAPVTAKAMAWRFDKLLQEMAAPTESADSAKPVRLKDVSFMGSEEKKALAAFNLKGIPYTKDQTVHQLFELQAERTPERIAVCGNERRLTYQTLNHRANRIARILREKGVGRESIVAILTERSPETIAAILAIIKVGGAYLPIDPDYPRERISYILADSNPQLIITQRSLTHQISGGRDTIPLEEICTAEGEGVFKSDANLPNLNTSADLAYLIYTSGSTGKPKGVMVEHRNLAAYVSAFLDEFALGPEDMVLQQASYAFDVFVEEVYPALLSGAGICIATKSQLMDLDILLKLLRENRVTVISCSPLLLNELNRAPRVESVHTYISGGDVLQREYVTNLVRIAKVYNTYGPTETTVCATYYRLQEEMDTPMGEPRTREPRTPFEAMVNLPANVPIGKPILHYRVDVCDTRGAFLPVGIHGEICISGAGTARGYLNQPELTAEKFVVGAFRESPPVEGQPQRRETLQRIYRTGDRGRWLANGVIEFLGRIDEQVKIRGFRIEPGEIEARLRKHQFIEDVVVIDREGPAGDKVLCAYYVPAPGLSKEDEASAAMEPLTASEALDPSATMGPAPLVSMASLTTPKAPAPLATILRDFIKAELPDYMVPTYFIPLARIPVTPNGKINRRLLPDPVGNQRNLDAPVPPKNEIEVRLATLWQDILKVNEISSADDFFQLGGNSLKVIVLASRIRKEFQVEVSVNDLFQIPTIQGIAGVIARAGKTPFTPIEKLTEAPFYPTSSAQKRLFSLNRLEPDSVSYNIPLFLLLEMEVDRVQMERVARDLMKRHEALRTAFSIEKGELVQLIQVEPDFTVSEYEGGEPEFAELISHFVRPFDLGKAPLMRMGLVNLPDGRRLFMMDIHHIIADETSINILMQEFVQLYNGLELAPLRIQYKEFAAWQNQFMDTETFQKEAAYWERTFSTAVPLLNLPIDHDRPETLDFSGDQVVFEADPETTSGIKGLANNGTTVFMVLLAAYDALLANLSCSEDVVVGIPVSGRTHADFEGVVGMFVNTLAIRSYPAGAKTFRDLLAEVKENLVQAYENQDYPLEMLIKQLNIRRESGRNPLFDTMFSFRDLKNNPPIPGFQPYQFENKVAKFDLSLYVTEGDTRIDFALEYRIRLFQKTTIEKFAEYYLTILKTVVQNPDVRINELLVQTTYEAMDLGEVEFNF